MVLKAAVPVFKKLIKPSKVKGYTPKPKKVLDHYEYEGKKYQPKDLTRVKRFNPETRKSVHVLIPREIEEARIAGIDTTPLTKPVKRKKLPKNIEMTRRLDELSDDELRYLTDEQSRAMGVDPGYYLGPYRQGRLGTGTGYGVKTKYTDEFGRPIYIEKYNNVLEKLNAKNSQIVRDTFSKINKSLEGVPTKDINAGAALSRHLGRMLAQAKVRKIPQDQVIKKFSEIDAPFFADLLTTRSKFNRRQTGKAQELGLIGDDELLELSHIIAAADDPMKSFDKGNVFLSMQKQNRNRAKLQQPEENFIQNYEDMLDDLILKYYGYAKGGLIKKGLQKIIDNTKFDPSRRKFLKQTGATAAAAAMPGSALKGASALAQVAVKEVTRKSPPWIKNMVGMLNTLSGPSAMGRTLSNGTRIRNYGSKGGRQEFEIVNSDGYKLPVYMNKNKDGDIHIEFDIRDDFQNNQHIYIDRKTGTTEIVDENFYMTSPEDYAKDDPIIFDVTTPSQMQDLEKRMGVMRGDVDDRMIDFSSVPDDYDYADMFESLVDSFSPSGNIFNTKKAAQQLKQKRAYENMTEEQFEAQFRGGTLHGFRRGGSTIRPKPKPPTDRIVPKPKPDRYQVMPDNLDFNRLMNSIRYVESRGDDFARNVDTQATGAFQILPSTAKNPGYGVTPFRNFDTDPFNLTEQTRFANDYVQALVNHYDGDYQKALSQYGGDSTPNYFNKIMDAYYRYNKGGLAKNATHDEMVAYIRKNPQEYAVGGIVKKLAPKVIGKLREYSPKLTGPKQKFSVFDEAGLPIKDFNKFDDAMKFAKEEPSYTVGNTPKPKADDTTTAMFWPSREKLIDAPFETAKGSEWLAYLKRPFSKHNPVKDMELNDTQLSTHLSRNSNKKLSKADVIKDFDEKLAPDIDVIVLGGGRNETSQSIKNLMRLDLQGFRPGPLRNTLGDLQLRINPLAEAIGNNDKQGILKGISQIEDSVQKNFGVPNAITEGFPQKFPFELKQPLQELAQLSGVRLAGFKEYAREAIYRGQQTLSGGGNYREFLFKYNHKPGSLRNTEPTYTYAHDFGLTSSQRAGGFVHMRTSDRTDAFGRRILHIEEIQSDMHQPVNAAARRVKKYQADQAARGESLSDTRAYRNDVEAGTYAPRGDLVKEVDSANEQQMMLIQAKIDDLLQLPQTQQTQVRIARLNRERSKIRKIIADKRAKAGEGAHSGVPQGPYSKTEDYNEFVMKYALKTAQDGGYDGISISTPQIKNLSTSQGSRDYMGNITAYGPIAQGAMKKVGKKSGAKFMKTVITDDRNRAYEVPTLIIKDNPVAQDIISKGLGAYKRGGLAVNG